MRKANPAGEVTRAKDIHAGSCCGARDGQAVGEVTWGLLLVCEAGNGEKKHVKLVKDVVTCLARRNLQVGGEDIMHERSMLMGTSRWAAVRLERKPS